jgi:hypothetical protein
VAEITRRTARVQQAALALAEQGIPVFPCRPQDKKPLIKHGFKDATTDPAQIRAWWRKWPEALIGTPTGQTTGWLVIDVDPPDGETSLLELEARLGKLPETRVVRTPSGGRHLYFAMPQADIGGSASKLAPNIDIRTNGGYIISAPSWNLEGAYVELTDTEPAELPPAWVRALSEAKPGKTKPKFVRATVATESKTAALLDRARIRDGVPEGERDDSLFRLACSYRTRGLAEDEIATLVLDAARRCQPPFPEDEALEKVRSAMRYADESQKQVARLAAMPALERERELKTTAKQLGVGVTVLREEVKRAASALAAEQEADGLDPVAEPWDAPVDGAELLDAIAEVFATGVALPEHGAETLALWAAHTYAYDMREISPFLTLISATPRCGKTRTLTLLRHMSRRPLPASNITPASVFRAIEEWHPTLLIDEGDSFLREREELRGILNSGHQRDLAYVVRVEKDGSDNYVPRKFSTWCPKAIALIGKLAATLHDRSIVIPLRRRHPGEKIERIDPELLQDLPSMIVRWCTDHEDAIRNAAPRVPPGLNDRAQDNWRPLLAIADVAGGEWPRKAREAADALSKSEEDADHESVGVMLLADIRSVFDADPAANYLGTGNLLEELHQLVERPWPTADHGRPLTARQLAQRLKPFGIVPTMIGGKANHRGYYRRDFEDAWSRWLFFLQDRENPQIAQYAQSPSAARSGIAGIAQIARNKARDKKKQGFAYKPRAQESLRKRVARRLPEL